MFEDWESKKCLWIGRVYLHGFVKNKLSKCKNVVLNKPEISYGYLTPLTLPPFFILLYISQFFFDSRVNCKLHIPKVWRCLDFTP